MYFTDFENYTLWISTFFPYSPHWHAISEASVIQTSTVKPWISILRSSTHLPRAGRWLDVLHNKCARRTPSSQRCYPRYARSLYGPDHWWEEELRVQKILSQFWSEKNLVLSNYAAFQHHSRLWDTASTNTKRRRCTTYGGRPRQCGIQYRTWRLGGIWLCLQNGHGLWPPTANHPQRHEGKLWVQVGTERLYVPTEVYSR